MIGRLRGRDSQAGITVIEMATVVALLSVVLALAFQSLSAYQRATAGSDARLRNLEEARLVMGVITRDLRTATDIQTIDVDLVIFKGYLDTATATNTPTLAQNWVRLCVDVNNQLLETVVAATATAPTNSCTITTGTRVVGKGVQVTPTPTTDPWPFDYQDKAGVPTSAADQVASVVVNLKVDLPSSAPAPATELSTQVFLPNVAAAEED